ncbi:LysR family transcriptional regulator [Piscinibacter sp.]|uniref:LysR family transcriptional regulator n=1 Tax=Piscinibacter sp. TaxID=1903157 RepID=UPI0039E43B32
MDLARLRALRELSMRGTMNAVAQALHVTPSAISQQIAQLEREAGLALTERHGRSIRLTHAGQVLAQHAEQAMAVLDSARASLAEIRGEVAGEVRIAAFPSAAAALLPRAINALRKSHPRLEPVLIELEPAEGLAALASWQADVALVDDLSLASGAPAGIVQTALTDDTLVALVSRRHALARRESVTVDDLAADAWAMDSSSSAYAEFILGLCRRAGFEPRVNARCRGFEMVAACVAAGCSVSVIPAMRRRQAPRGVAMIELRPQVRRRISMAHRSGERHHPAIQAVIAELAAGIGMR